MKVDLNSWETRIVLEALRSLDREWTAKIEGSDDEDIQSEYGNDRGQLLIVQDRLEAQAVEQFGPNIKDFSRTFV